MEPDRLPNRHGSPEPGRPSTVVFSVAYALLAGLAWIIAEVREDPSLYAHGLPLFKEAYTFGPAIGLVFGLLVVALSRLCYRFFDWAKTLNHEFRGVLGELSGQEVLVLAVVSSIGEEMLFRGALIPWIGLIPATLVFGLLHIGPNRHFIAWTLSALVIGLGLGLLFLWTGSIGGPIVAHFVINYLNLGFITKPVADSGSSSLHSP